MLTALALSREWLDRFPVAVCVCDCDGKITAWNQRAADLWGCAPRPGACMSGAVRVYDSNGKAISGGQGPIAAVLKTGRAARNVELSLERRDGTRVPVLSSVAPLRNEEGTVIGALDVFQDISDRKRIEEARRVAERIATSARVATNVAAQINTPLASVNKLLDALRREPGLSAEARLQAERVHQQLTFFDKLKRELGLLSNTAQAAAAEV